VVEVSAEFAEIVATALRIAARTNGLVDPTLGEAIEAAGYDRDFAELRPDRKPPQAGSRAAGRPFASAVRST
jgi:thiamine biosynthesis lipoprotein